MNKGYVFFIGMIFCFHFLIAGELGRFRVSPVTDGGVALVPVLLGMDGLCTDSSGIGLFELTKAGEKEIPSQVEWGPVPVLWFLFDNSGQTKTYVIRELPQINGTMGRLTLEKDEQALTILDGRNPVLSYRHAECFPPEGVDPKFKRSGFIHPLWSPGGEILTRIQPPDHYHHYGIWNPWTKTTIDGREIDFWNLYKGQGTVKFAGYLDAVGGPVFAGFKVHQEHVYMDERGREKLAMNEVWDVRVWKIPGKNVSVVDLTSTLNTPLPGGIVLEAYRYGGGFGFRATEKWTNTNSTILTSENKTRKEADGTNARWCITEGESSVPEGRSGILFLSHPANRMHPEPMRVWPADANGGRGDLFFEFCPIRHTGWKIEPLENQTLKYRMVVFDGKITAVEAEYYWKCFSQFPEVEMIYE
jgi:hypothetical protein